MCDPWGYQKFPGANLPMHPLVKDAFGRTHPVPVRSIATGATAVGAACHLVEMATVRTRLGRVRFTNLDQLDAVTTELVFQVQFPAPKLQRPHILIRPPRSAAPLFIVESTEIARVKDREAVSEAKRDDLIGRMMQGIARHPFDFLTSAVPCAVQSFSSS